MIHLKSTVDGANYFDLQINELRKNAEEAVDTASFLRGYAISVAGALRGTLSKKDSLEIIKSMHDLTQQYDDNQVDTLQ